ncbi:unnamed protein product [Merluccius merluccius]
MSSLFSTDKDQTRNRKSLFDSSSTLPHVSSRIQRAATDYVLRLAASLFQTAGQGAAQIARLDSGSPAVSNARAGSLPDPYVSPRENRLSARRRTEEDAGCKDFKKLYEGALAANGRLRSRLETSREELALVQSQLGRVISQQAKTELTTENQRLKDENGALIRVISKLSK